MGSEWQVSILAASVALGLSGAALAQESQPIKPLLRGIVSMGNIAFHRQDGGIPDNSLDNLVSRPGIFGGVVINATWAQLQPTPESLRTDAIERALADIRVYNQRNPAAPLMARLRVWAGPNAPDWIKTLGGPPVTVLHKDMQVTIGRFWSDEYRQAWRKLQAGLAQKYDAEPLIRELSNTSCSSITNEPFVLPGDPLSLGNLHGAGFNDRQYQDCLAQSAGDYAAWTTTRIEFPFNPFRSTDGPHPRQIPEVSYQIMREWRRSLGPRGVLSNLSLEYPPPPFMEGIYDMIRSLGPPIEFETHSPDGLDWDAAIRFGVELGATAIELWPRTKKGGFEEMPPEKLKEWSAAILRNQS